MAEEADESVFWLEYIRDSGDFRATQLAALENEGAQLVRIMQASRGTARRNQ